MRNRNFLMRNCSERYSLLLILGAIIFIGGLMPEVYASDILEGIPQTESGGTVYIATVESNQTPYSSVFGVKGNNTDYSSHGRVIIKNGVDIGTVYGNRAISGDNYVHASYNTVDITDSSIGTVYGGYAYGGNDNAGVQNNKVTITGGNITGYVYGGSADGATISVTGNEVVIKDNAQIGKTVYGGCAFNTESWLSMLRNNVVIENSTVNGSVYGGYASGSATASNNNSVTIGTDTFIKGSVYGGYALSSNSDAKNNIVIIDGGTVNSHIYGGIGRNASNNTIVIKGGNLTNADLYGYSDGRKSHSGNTLELWSADTEIKSAQNFENYFFLVPQDIVNQADRYMLKVNEPVNLTGANIGIAIQGNIELQNNATINLIDKVEGTPDLISLDGKTIRGKDGTSLIHYDFDLSLDNGKLTATVKSVGRNLLLTSAPNELAGKAYAEAKSLSEGQVASVALLEKGSELAMSLALPDAEKAVHIASANGKTWATFLTLDYARTDYYTDSHIRMNNADFIAGIAREFSSLNTENLFGIYFETGHGNYSTFNSFEIGSVFGNGNSHYYGGGFMLQVEPSEKEGLYFQALGRIGGINNNWATDDLLGKEGSYATQLLYYGAASGLGYQNKIWNSICYDVHGQFMWTHQNGDIVSVNDKTIEFQNINSLKTGMGLKIAYDGWKIVQPFIGITWEKEYNSDLKGNSGVLELGMTCKPENKTNWKLDLVASGYIGVRRELRGSVLFTLNF